MSVFGGRKIDGSTLYFQNQWHAKKMISHVLSGSEFFGSVVDICTFEKAESLLTLPLILSMEDRR
jgi:hypothetical protein